MNDLTRKLNIGHAIAIIIGTVIGSGVFINIPIVAKISGSPVLASIAWLIGGLIWIPQILVITEMATAYPEEGFGYLYLRKAGSPSLAFLYVWTVFLTSDTPSITIVALTAISSISIFFPFLNDPVISRIMASILIIILTIPHLRDVKQGGNIQIILTIAKLAPLLILIIIGSFYFGSGNIFLTPAGGLDLNATPGILIAGVAATVWSYAGFPNILYMAGEIKNPHKTLPKALIGSVVGVMLAFVLISITTSAIVPYNELISFTGSFANPFQYLPVFSNYASGFLAIAAFISMVGCINGSIMVQPRMEYAIAKDGFFFKIFSHVHPKFQTPDYSIIIQSGIAICMTIVGGLESLLGYFTLSYILQNALVYFTIFWLKKRDDYKPTYKCPIWRTMAVVSIIVQLALAYGTFLAYSSEGVIISAIFMLSGLPLYYYFKKTKKSTNIME